MLRTSEAVVRARTPAFLEDLGARIPTFHQELIDAIIPVKSPDMDWLDLTLGALEQQTARPGVTIVDCHEPPVTVDTDLEAQVITADCSIAGQRRAGMAATDGQVVMHLDEDAVLTQPDHVERALDRLHDPGVAGVGGTVSPIRGNRLGRLAAALSPARAWFPMHFRSVCPDGAACFPADRELKMFHNDDLMLKRRLAKAGRVVQDDDLVVLTDLPTRKQKTALAAIGAAGALLGAGRSG